MSKVNRQTKFGPLTREVFVVKAGECQKLNVAKIGMSTELQMNIAYLLFT